MNSEFQLELEGFRYVISGDKWISSPAPWDEDEPPNFGEYTGNALIYPEHDLLWIGFIRERVERFKTLANFEKAFNASPKWSATTYAVIEGVFSKGSGVGGVGVMLCECHTGWSLSAPACEVEEVERVRARRSVAQLMRGEKYKFI